MVRVRSGGIQLSAAAGITPSPAQAAAVNKLVDRVRFIMGKIYKVGREQDLNGLFILPCLTVARTSGPYLVIPAIGPGCRIAQKQLAFDK